MDLGGDGMSNETELVQSPIDDVSPEVREIIERVLKLEKYRLDRRSISRINEEVLYIIREVVR
jgi:hypothetical protein